MSKTQTPDEAIRALETDGFAGWRAVSDRPAIAKRFKFADFDAAFAFMTAVAAHASAADHHPEWSNVYSKVEVLLTTHSAGGVTEKDLALARAMEAAARG
jgi:4a-hydroxytetrahydrobiopterin dehydratase